MRIVAAVVNVRQDGLRPVFSGGTSLSKGYGLVRRFSEDLDFKTLLPEADAGRTVRRRYRAAIVDAIRADGDWTIGENDVLVSNESRFFRCVVGYSPIFAPASHLRPGIRLEVMLARSAIPPEEQTLRSFVAEALREEAEVPRIACVAPAETAADKLSALTWRVLDRRRGREDDDALVRHLHDLAALETHAKEYRGFPGLLDRVLNADTSRGELPAGLANTSSGERVAAALEIVANDPRYGEEYARFVGAMCYGRESETPTFHAALEAVRRIGRLLSK